MSGTPILSLSLEGQPRRIVVVASSVAVGHWYQISLLLADQTPPVGLPLLVRPEVFLGRRIGLIGLLRELGVGIEADDAVRELLSRNRQDQAALNAAMNGNEPPAFVDDADNDGGRAVIRDLRWFQQRDFDRLAGLRHGANFSVPGAGKTTVTYVLHARERRAGRATRLLVVAPLSAFGAWEDDVIDVLDPPLRVARYRGGPVPNADVLLVNYERLPSSIETLTQMMIDRPTHLVLDEAHRAKRGVMGEWGRALLALAPFAARRDVLTGTPAPNQPRDLVAILDILWPGGAAQRMIPPAALRVDPDTVAMRDLNQVIAPLYARTTKNELGLRTPSTIIRPVRMGDLQQQIYDAMLSRYSGMFDLDRRDAAMFSQMGEVTMYLLQAASSPRLLARNGGGARPYAYPSLAIPAGTSLARLVDEYADHEVPAKVALVCRMIQANRDDRRKTLLWSNFPVNLLDLEQQLSGLNPAIVYGSIPSREDAPPGVRTREREIDRFRNDEDCWVMLANPAAMSEGVSLHLCCNDAIYLDRTFNAGQYLQSVDRIHRLGLDPETETRITILTSAETIDTRVNGRVADKARRLGTLLDDQTLVEMALPDEDEVGGVLDDALDLQAVMEHLRQGRPRGEAGE